MKENTMYITLYKIVLCSLIAISSIILSGCGTSGDSGSSSYTTGSSQTSSQLIRGSGARKSLPEEKATFLVVLDPETMTSKANSSTSPSPSPSPSAMIPSNQLPPVLDQWGLLSCGAFALGYAVDTIVVNQAAGTNPQQVSNQSSPAYMYAVALNAMNMTNAAQDQGSNGGSSACDYFDYLVSYGSQSCEQYTYPGMDLPTPETSPNFWEDNSTIEKAINPILDSLIKKTAPPPNSQFQLGDWGVIYPDPTSNSGEATTFSSKIKNAAEKFLHHVKAIVASGLPVGISVQEYSDYSSWNNMSAGSVMDPPVQNLNTDYHFMTVIGYDDTISYTNSDGKTSKGAVRIQNSWGITFGDSGGYFWLSYPAFLKSINEAYVAYPVGNVSSDDPSYVHMNDKTSGDAFSLAKITRAYQKLHTEVDGTQVVDFVLHYQFSEPLRFKYIHLTGPGGNKMTISGGRFSRRGYRYVSRSDGNQFTSGSYKVSFEVEDLQKQVHILSGTVNVPALSNLPENDSTDGVLGSNGQPVQ